MASVSRKRYTATQNGERVTKLSRRWYVHYRDEHGVRRAKPAFNDKQASNQLAAQIERDVERRKSGLVDQFAEHLGRPLSDHVQDFRADLERKGNTKAHAKLVVSRVAKVLAGSRSNFWGDLSPSKVQAYVAGILVGKKEANLKPASQQTKNFYLAAVKQFARWMVRDGRAPANPLQHLQGGNARADRHHDRRALGDDEMASLLEAARTGPRRNGMTGSARAVLYLLAVESGVRANELRTLAWNALGLDATPPTLTVRAGYSKHRREDVLPLRPAMVRELRTLSRQDAGFAGDDLVFPGMPSKPVSILRFDLAAARQAWLEDAQEAGERAGREQSDFLSYVDRDGCYADFHALRHTFITNLARGGVHPKQTMDLARHSDINLTLARYSHTAVVDQAAALESLPDLSPGSDRHEQRATGTDGKAVPGFLLQNGLQNLPQRVASQQTPVARCCKK